MELTEYIDRYYKGNQKAFAETQFTSKGTTIKPTKITEWKKRNAEIIFKDERFQIRFVTQREFKDGKRKLYVRWLNITQPKQPLSAFDFSLFHEENCPVKYVERTKPIVLAPEAQNEISGETLKQYVDKYYGGVKRHFSRDQITSTGRPMPDSYVTKMEADLSLRIVEIDGDFYARTVKLRKLTKPKPKD